MTATTTDELSFPRYVYKILSEEPPNPLSYNLPLTPLDKQDGFIHLSCGWRVPQTAALYFGSYTTIWLLRIDTSVAQAEDAHFKWGDPGCIHMYSHDETRWARMGDGVVVAVRKVEKGAEEEWGRLLNLVVEEGWLVGG
ncbi:hypothetical protein B0F90DRAFT_1625516 [Multifurca ochricompacta]|uniref:Uncharacterized protein n=1 Tax=Multifurca ochricompacta TaxID=376703 RepID=A0AAD4QNT5_9AGAM|nr:hypothetical protein B0F90DRAFT_1625516 [Multifurca ochricompacta]